MNKFYHCLNEIEFALKNYIEYRTVLCKAIERTKITCSPADIRNMYESILSLEKQKGSLTLAKQQDDELPIFHFPAVVTDRKADSQALEKHFTIVEDKIKHFAQMPENSLSGCDDKIAMLYQLFQDTNILKLSRMRPGGEKEPLPDREEYFPGSLFCCTFWNELARLKRIMGKEADAALLELRCMRFLGRDYFGHLPKTCSTLERYGYNEEKLVANMMFGQYDSEESRTDAIHTYLNMRLKKYKNVPDLSYERIYDARHADTPKITVIVSLYNADQQIEVFLTCLARQSMAKNRQLEVIIQDSCSPGTEYDVIKNFIQKSNLSIFYGRSFQRETVHAAWNRGIKVARAPYLVFLGVDEMLYPDALEKMFNAIEQDKDIDWVMAGSILTNVDKNGVLEEDIAVYNYLNADKYLYYLDHRYIRMVGGISKKSIHERFGFYDEIFNCTGCDEFIFRILPFINVKYINVNLGIYLDYPTERMSSSLLYRSIEHLRSFAIHRTYAGTKYALKNIDNKTLMNLFFRCYNFRRAVCKHNSTDFTYGNNIYLLLNKTNENYKSDLDHFLPYKLLELIRNSSILSFKNNNYTLFRNYNKLISNLKQIESCFNKQIPISTNYEFNLFNEFLFQREFTFLVSGFFHETNVFRV
jgi:glycosyltransferase involved in cell wall biosynthesis